VWSRVGAFGFLENARQFRRLERRQPGFAADNSGLSVSIRNFARESLVAIFRYPSFAAFDSVRNAMAV
jgi:hypothetical protein